MLSHKVLISIFGGSALFLAFNFSNAVQAQNKTLGDDVPLSQQTLNEFDRKGNSTYSLDGAGNLNVMDLIHNHNLFGGQSAEQFNKNQNRTLNSAVEDFRSQQRQKLVETQSAAPSESPEVVQ